LNHAPNSEVEIHLIVENCEERLSFQESLQLLADAGTLRGITPSAVMPEEGGEEGAGQSEEVDTSLPQETAGEEMITEEVLAQGEAEEEARNAENELLAEEERKGEEEGDAEDENREKDPGD